MLYWNKVLAKFSKSFSRVEPKQVLYWNREKTLIDKFRTLVEPKQVLYWNYLTVSAIKTGIVGRTETSVVLKSTYKHVKPTFCQRRTETSVVLK